MSPRLTLALEGGGLSVPPAGTIAVLYPRAGQDLSSLPRDRVLVVQPNRVDHDALAAAGYQCVSRLDDAGRDWAAALVCLPRAKALARALVAAAARRTAEGPVIVDGAKTDGADSLMRAMRTRVRVNGPIAKAHGKLFWVTGAGDAFDDWAAQAGQVDGFRTAPGVFSADGIDPASRLLADALPARLGKTVADLGAGWGYLSARLLERTDIETVFLVEADRTALDCAQANVTDPRARFCWADATRWMPDAPLDAVVMNPPFHTDRSADPGLGRAFIAAAARVLAPSGKLWLVANRHLPYETALAAAFAKTGELSGGNRFKILWAERPSRPRR